MFWWIIQHFIVTAVLAAVVAAVCRLLRARPTICHALWLLLLVKFLTPPLVVWPWALPTVAQSEVLNHTSNSLLLAEAANPARENSAHGETVDDDSLIVRSELLVVPLEDGAIPRKFESAPQASAAPASSVLANELLAWITLHWQWIMISIWLVGATAHALVQMLRISKIARLLALAEDPPPLLRRRVERLAKRMNIHPPQIAVVPVACSPMVFALGRSRLIWPTALLDEDAVYQWEGVLIHELAHLRRRDHWIGWLELAAACFWWWNPVFWYVRYQLRENAELACDAWVVGMLPGGRRAYAEALVTVCDQVSQATEPLPALGFGQGARRAFERRLTMVLTEHVSFRLSRLAVLSVLLLGLLALPSWSQVPAGTPQSEGNGRTDTPAANTPTPVAGADSLAGGEEERATQSNDQAPSKDAPRSLGAGPRLRRPVSLGDNSADATAASTGNSPQSARLKKLEELVQKLTAELQSLKPKRNTASRPPMPRAPSSAVSPWAPIDVAIANTPLAVVGTRSTAESHVAETQILSRTTYRLPKEKADALREFIESHVEAEVSVRVDSDPIVVTTTPADQEVIGKFIALMQGRVSPRVRTPINYPGQRKGSSQSRYSPDVAPNDADSPVKSNPASPVKSRR